jgi:protein-disulfide isomerase
MYHIPSFFINGRLREGAHGPELTREVAKEMAAAERRVAAGSPRRGHYEAIIATGATPGSPRRRVQLPPLTERHPTRGGGPDAVDVHELCDLSSVFCARLEPALRATLAPYGDRVRLVWWTATDDAAAVRVARAAHATNTGLGPGFDGFWKMHDALLDRGRRPDFEAPAPEELSPTALRDLADRLGADLTTFDYVMNMDSLRELDDLIAAWTRATRAAGVSRIPSIVIDGELFEGFEPMVRLRRALDRALAAQRRNDGGSIQ